MPKLTRAEMLEIVKLLRDALEPVLIEEARHRADEGLGRVLRMDDYDLHERVNSTISKVVREEVEKYLNIQVSWRGEDASRHQG